VPERKRFLFFATSMGVGGIERMWSNLLPGLISRGADVKLVTLNARGATFDLMLKRGVDSTFLNAGNGLTAIKALPGFLSITREFRPDAIMSFEPSCGGLAAIASRVMSVPHVLNWHQQVGRPYEGTSKQACRAAAALGSGVLAGSSANFADVMRLGFPRDRLAVARTGVHGPTSLPESPDDRGQIQICVAARLAPEKRIDVFIDAMALLRDSVPNATATVMGDGPLRTELEDLARQRNVPITFTGNVAEPMNVMLESQVACLTSDFETTPLALMEAAACGLPVVTTDAGAVREIVIDGTTAIVCERGDARAVAHALAELALDPARRRRMAEAARRHWQQSHSIEAMVDSYWALLTTLKGPPVAWP